MVYRTKTYIAADWDNDKDAVNKLYEWNNSEHWSLSFNDAHDLTQARDNSLNCSIKESLAKRLTASKTFVLIVGVNTKSLKSGSCEYCKSYNSHTRNCAKGYLVDYRSYIEYECDKAISHELKIVVLYKDTTVNKSKCPNAVKNVITHVAMLFKENGKYYWNYQAVKYAINS